MEHTNTVHDLFEKAGGYLETRVDLLKLQAVNKSSEIISSIVSRIVIVTVLVMFILMLNIGLAFWVGELVGKVYYGFFIVAGFYALLGWIIYLCRKSWLQTPVSNSLIKKMLN